jgi:hypothetical protein
MPKKSQKQKTSYTVLYRITTVIYVLFIVTVGVGALPMANIQANSIVDNSKRGVVLFSNSVYHANEDHGIVTIERTGMIEGSLSVALNYEAFAAMASNNHIPISNTITFTPEETLSVFTTIPILEDSSLEGSETLILHLLQDEEVFFAQTRGTSSRLDRLPLARLLGASSDTVEVKAEAIEVEWADRMLLEHTDSVRVSLFYTDTGHLVPQVEVSGHKALLATPVPVGTPGPLVFAQGEEYRASISANLVSPAFEIDAVNAETYHLLEQPDITWEWSIMPRYAGKQVLNLAIEVQWKLQNSNLPPIQHQAWRERLEVLVEDPANKEEREAIFYNSHRTDRHENPDFSISGLAMQSQPSPFGSVNRTMSSTYQQRESAAKTSWENNNEAQSFHYEPVKVEPVTYHQPDYTGHMLIVATLIPSALAVPIVLFFLKQHRQNRTQYFTRVLTLADRLHIFLSYAPADRQAVRNLYWRLHTDTFKPWMDSEDLLAGQDWRQTITKAIRDSDFIIVCLSNHVVSKTGHFNKEMKLALDIADEQPEGTIFLIPLKLEACDLPDRLSHLHPVNLFEKDGFERLLRALQEH